ncbi:sulfatase-like hydrolase/transferase [Lutibacter citreus]|uniref:sulfatase-like hydrolase/transferase n=1 Tax=Lutibacter citreus TaxID=2138210 RepID=UPI000DBE4F99|nr:sulfatase-like hydrolase/transferase [Lutibacter citreus]
MRHITLILSISSALFFSTCIGQQKAETQKPNIILIYADDLGRGLLGAYGQKIITTPNIDRLADEGIRFENVYGSHYCAPARASLLTGMHDCRTNKFNIVRGGIYMKLDNGLNMQEIKDKVHALAIPAKPDDIFLGQVAKDAGYATAEFGKLEWGFATTPERIKRHGWDYHFGYYDHRRCHGFYPPFLFENGEKVNIPGNTHVDCAKTPVAESPENYKIRWNMEGKKVYSENIIMDKLLRYLDNNNPKKTNKPFFIHFPTQLPHGPIAIPEVHKDFKNNSNLTELEKEYASMVKMLDTNVGSIVSKLEEMDILDNTIIIFTGDNGHSVYYQTEGRGSEKKNVYTGEVYDNIKTKFYSRTSNDVFDGNDGMAGFKRANWEGGTRVPLIWYWKGKIQPGSSSNQMVANFDLLNTISEITSGKQVEGKDGVSYLNTVLGKKSNVRDYTITASKMGPALVTKEGWKLRYYLKKDIFQLYYLPEDYREENNLILENKGKFEELKTLMYKVLENDWNNGYGPKTLEPNY